MNRFRIWPVSDPLRVPSQSADSLAAEDCQKVESEKGANSRKILLKAGFFPKLVHQSSDTRLRSQSVSQQTASTCTSSKISIMPEHSMKLYYFPMRGRGETSRLLFAYGGKKFEDVRIPVEQWPAMKESMHDFAYDTAPLAVFTRFQRCLWGKSPFWKWMGNKFAKEPQLLVI